jgi:two-component system alkaline phosphatase synthesis response regulator PhoP
VTVTVLVVEDELKLRDLVRRYLERENWTVVTTGSGAEALSILERGGIDLMVLDLNLPDVTGETIAAEFSGRVPIVMLTAKPTGSTAWNSVRTTT